MAQLIVPSVDLQLQNQYAQHYASDTGVPFQINPANELKPVAEAMKAFAQYDARVKESESNIEAQNALNEFNEYKSKRLTDLQQMPLGKAVDAYAGLDTDLELFAKQSGAKINSARAKAKFDASIGSALSNGRAQGYAVHAQQVTQHEEKVDSATIDLASQDVASKVGTPEYQTAMESFKGTIGIFSNKYGFTSEEATAFERNETKKIFINAGNNLITTKQFGKCAEMLHTNQSKMDSFTYNDLNAKLHSAMEADAKQKAAEARQRKNEALSDVMQLFSAAQKAGQHDDAKVYAGEVGKINPALGKLLEDQANNAQADTNLAAYKIAVNNGDNVSADRIATQLLGNMDRMSPEDNNLTFLSMVDAIQKRDTKEATAQDAAITKYVEAQKENLKNYKSGKEYKKAAQTVLNIGKYRPDLVDALVASLSREAVEYYDELIKNGTETNNDTAVIAGANGVNDFLPNLGEDNQVDLILQSRQQVSNARLKQAEEMSKKNVSRSVELYNLVANDPLSTATAKEQAKAAIQKVGADQLIEQAEVYIKNKDGASLGALLWTREQNGSLVPTILSNQLEQIAPNEITRLRGEWQKINADAIADEQTSAVKNKGFSPSQRKTCLDGYITTLLDGENGDGVGGMVQTEMVLQGIEQTDKNYKIMRAQLKDQIMPQAQKYVQEQSDAYYEAKTAEGAVTMAAFRNAERVFNNLLEDENIRMAASTTTNPFSIIPQKTQDEILSSFTTKEQRDDFIQRFTDKYSNHAEGNPQSMERVISDIDAGVYNNLDLNSFSKQLQHEHKELSVVQLNECEKKFRETIIKERDGVIKNRSDDLYQILSKALGYDDFKDLEKGSAERVAVIDTVAQLNQEVRRKSGYTSDPKTLNKNTFETLGDANFIRNTRLIEGGAKTYEMITNNWKERVEQARVTLGQEQAAGAYQLTNSRDGYMSYSHDLAGYNKLKNEGSILGTKYQIRKQKEFLNSFTSEELEQLRKDQDIEAEQKAQKNTAVEE